jgi:hypothetical protein
VVAPAALTDASPLLSLGLSAFLLLVLSFLSLPGPLFSLGVRFPNPPWAAFLLGLGGFLLLVIFFRRLPVGKVPAPQPSPLRANLALLMILVAAAFLRLAGFLEPQHMYWTDYSHTSIDARAVLDLKLHHLIFPMGSRPALYQYFVAGVFLLLPGVKTYVAQNVAFALMDLIGLWVLYLLGREAGGRRVGLILAAWGAVSKPLLVLCMTQQTCATGQIALSTVLLFTLRMMKRPDLRRSLEWGAALAMGAYLYQSVRPYLLFLPLAVLAGWWTRPSSGSLTFVEKVTVPVSALLWTVYFLLFNRFMPALPWLSGWKPMVAVLLGMLVPPLLARLAAPPGSATGRGLNWMAGLVLAGALMYPIVSLPEYSTHVNDVSTLHRDGVLRVDGETLGTIWRQYQNTLSTLFLSGWDHPYMSYPGETFFEAASLPLVFAGLAFLAARPDRLKGFLLLCALVGMAPHFLSGDTHSGKLQGVVPPLYLLGALAVGRVLERMGPRARRTAVVGLALYGLVAGAVMFHRFYIFQAERQTPERMVYTLAKRDRAEGRKVYFFGTPKFHNNAYGAAVLCQGMDVSYLRHEHRRLWLAEGEPVPDVAVYLHGEEDWAIRQLREEYPGAFWEGHRNSLQGDPSAPPLLMRLLIPGSLIPEAGVRHSGDPWISVRRAPTGWWRRVAYIGGAGLDEAFVYAEDRTPRLGDPFEVNVNGFTARMDGVFHSPETTEYAFRAESGHYTLFDLDGKRVIDERPHGGRVAKSSVTLRVAKGDHPVRLRTFFWSGLDIPRIRVVYPGGVEKDL